LYFAALRKEIGANATEKLASSDCRLIGSASEPGPSYPVLLLPPKLRPVPAQTSVTTYQKMMAETNHRRVKHESSYQYHDNHFPVDLQLFSRFPSG